MKPLKILSLKSWRIAPKLRNRSTSVSKAFLLTSSRMARRKDLRKMSLRIPKSPNETTRARQETAYPCKKIDPKPAKTHWLKIISLDFKTQFEEAAKRMFASQCS